MRKGAGISALQRQSATTASFSALSTSLSAQQLSLLTTSLSSFRTELARFASQHRGEIRRDPAFRHQFQRMCSAIGIDPLSAGSARPSWFADIGLADWTCELALQVVDVCLSTRGRNGGVIELGELTGRVQRMREGSLDEITEEDVVSAIEMLGPLRAGYRIVGDDGKGGGGGKGKGGGMRYVRSVPRELDTDQAMLLVLASETGGVLTAGSIQESTGWDRTRAETALGDCVMREGLGWVDDVDGSVWLMAAVEFDD